MSINIFSNSGKIAYDIKELVADKFADLPTGGQAPGSTAYVVEDNKTYMFNSFGEWIEVDSGNVTIKNQPLVEGEFDPDTGVPTISSPQEGVIYMVPSNDAQHTELFNEWVYVHDKWEKFGHATMSLEDYATLSDLEDLADVVDSKASQISLENGLAQKFDTSAALALSAQLARKQNSLIAGTNMEIKDNIISTIGISEYNTEPTPIGFWLNGETIVRQTFIITEGLAKDNWIKVTDKPAGFIELIDSKGTIKGSAATKYAQSNSSIEIYENTEGIFCKQNFTSYPEKMYITLEYTV